MGGYLGRAANLTSPSEETLKTERAANIGGGAAVLAAIAGNDRLPNLNGWYEAVHARTVVVTSTPRRSLRP